MERPPEVSFPEIEMASLGEKASPREKAANAMSQKTALSSDQILGNSGGTRSGGSLGLPGGQGRLRSCIIASRLWRANRNRHLASRRSPPDQGGCGRMVGVAVAIIFQMPNGMCARCQTMFDVKRNAIVSSATSEISGGCLSHRCKVPVNVEAKERKEENASRAGAGICGSRGRASEAWGRSR